jgi:hypothetical protein
VRICFIARWIFAPDDAQAASALASLPGGLAWTESDVVFEVAETGVVLHPAASPAEPGVPTLSYPLEPGPHAVATALYEPDRETCFELFQLRRT